MYTILRCRRELVLCSVVLNAQKIYIQVIFPDLSVSKILIFDQLKADYQNEIQENITQT